VRQSIEVKQAVLQDYHLLELVQESASTCVCALEREGKLILFGNGGSAADAQHLAAELTGRYMRERRALAAVALTTDTSCLTSIANDYSFDDVFSRQVDAIGKKGDIAIAISTSGNSKNVIQALTVAKEKGLTTIAMTGRTGGKLIGIADYCLCIPSEQTPRIQEAHILVGHILCEIIEDRFAG
jgi:D-sedoheptulose 7-phosphate isomerase